MIDFQIIKNIKNKAVYFNHYFAKRSQRKIKSIIMLQKEVQI
jgi:hypothetical protein